MGWMSRRNPIAPFYHKGTESTESLEFRNPGPGNLGKAYDESSSAPSVKSAVKKSGVFRNAFGKTWSLKIRG